MQTIQQTIYFRDEVPRFGCGYRGCNIKIGRKWVRIEERATGKRARVSMKTWRILVGEERQPLRRLRR